MGALGEPEPELEPAQVGHRILVGSDGRVAVQFTEPVEFYVMEPFEAFDLAQALLNAAYISRERKDGVLHPLGQKVLKDEPQENAGIEPTKDKAH